jgi:hypothetical protein
MYLVTIPRPLCRDEGAAQPQGIVGVRRALVDRLGGVSAFTRAPAEGKYAEGIVVAHNDVKVEVMVHEFDRGRWGDSNETLERQFAQVEILIRVLGPAALASPPLGRGSFLRLNNT